MRKNSLFQQTLSLTIILICSIITTQAQSIFNTFTQKYDTTFAGIGPEAYFLPAPQSKSESLIDQYKSINTANDSIKKLFLLQEYIANYENTVNQSFVREIIQSDTLQHKSWEKATEKEINAGSYYIAIGLLNEFAKQYVLEKNFDQAEQLLKKALEYADNDITVIEKPTLIANLYSLYLLNNKFKEVEYLENTTYKQALGSKSLEKQANSLIKLALLDAYQNNFSNAEATIIKKAIPLFNKTKDYNGKINAWIKLAEIYALNKKYTEAQWFLIQAQELANLKRIPNYDTTIEFLLGNAKFQQANLKVSEKELSKALKLAQENKNNYIELFATQLLGEIYLKQNRIPEAEAYIKSYWEIRNKIF